jgi:predicted proteasome-type protease
MSSVDGSHIAGADLTFWRAGRVQSYVWPVDAAGLQLLAGVGLPIDLAIARRDAFAFDVLRRIKPGETYLHNLSERRSAALRAAHKSIPRPVWTEAVVR